MDEYYHVVQALPVWLRENLLCIAPSYAKNVQEIRLREDCPVYLSVNGHQELWPESPLLTSRQIEEILLELCENSFHSYEDEIAQGFFTIPGGHRVGVGGRYAADASGRPFLQKVTSLNIRIARFSMCSLPAFLRDVIGTQFVGLLIAGEPSSGKTTLLRSLIPEFIQRKRLCVVIDERAELFSAQTCGSGCREALNCDRIEGLNKVTAIEMALRALGPQVLILDELASLQEAHQLERGIGSGVNIVITAHASSLKEAESKPQIQYLIRQGALRYACVLEGREHPGVLKEGKAYL